MSEITAVPLRPIKRSALIALAIGVAALIVIALGAAWAGTERQVRMAMPPEAFLAQNAKRSGVVTTASGLQYQVLKEGAGPRAALGDLVLVDYDGKLANGETFDASARHGGPAQLPVGGLIPGWNEGMQLMSKDAEYRFWIPPQLGYGPAGAGDGAIPPNALLIFDVTLRDIQRGGAMRDAGRHGRRLRRCRRGTRRRALRLRRRQRVPAGRGKSSRSIRQPPVILATAGIQLPSRHRQDAGSPPSRG